MLAWLKRLGNRRQTARSLYGSIVTQARSGVFYARWGVPDTAEGRFEMIVLHLVLVLRRLAREGRQGGQLARALTETFVVDLDDTLREMTVGDLAVPRQVKRAVGLLQNRHAAYGTALDARKEDQLAAAIRSALAPLRGAEGLDATRISAYISEAAGGLDLQPGTDILAGRPGWPQNRLHE